MVPLRTGLEAFSQPALAALGAIVRLCGGLENNEPNRWCRFVSTRLRLVFWMTFLMQIADWKLVGSTGVSLQVNARRLAPRRRYRTEGFAHMSSPRAARLPMRDRGDHDRLCAFRDLWRWMFYGEELPSLCFLRAGISSSCFVGTLSRMLIFACCYDSTCGIKFLIILHSKLLSPTHFHVSLCYCLLI